MTNPLRGPGRNLVGIGVRSAACLAGTGVVRPYSPRRLVALATTLSRWGTGPAGGFASLAVRAPERTAVIDELGTLTAARLHREANAVGRRLRDLGVGERDRVALMCRNHRWFVESTVAVTRLGADVLYLNTAFSGPQVRDLLERERPTVVVYDEEFAEIFDEGPYHRLLAWTESPGASGASGPGTWSWGTSGTLHEIASSGDGADLSPPQREGRNVILTSGTTGTPKGASRGSGTPLAAASLLSRIPLRYGWRTHLAAPMFHTWGWAHLNLAMMLGSTLVLTRRFEPEQFLATIRAHRCEAAAVIPVMLRRVLELPSGVLDEYDLGHLAVVASSGSALPGNLEAEWMDRFGDNLYNTYGSTECAWATIARPADMRAHPGTAGTPPIGTTIALLDDEGELVGQGEVGRINVSNSAQFEGYTSGGRRSADDEPARTGLLPTGDLGRIDDGLLFVEGRVDEMIVSGGENVYPQEVEDCLARHGEVVEAAAVPAPDTQFGQRLVAYVRRAAGSQVDEDELKEYVKGRLARYKVPRGIRFVDALPRNATGKVVKRDLVPNRQPDEE